MGRELRQCPDRSVALVTKRRSKRLRRSCFREAATQPDAFYERSGTFAAEGRQQAEGMERFRRASCPRWRACRAKWMRFAPCRRAAPASAPRVRRCSPRQPRRAPDAARDHGRASPRPARTAPIRTAAMTALLAIEQLTVRFAAAVVVDDVSLTIEAGEKFALVGESGSGKTITALSVLGLVDGAATSGRIVFAGADLRTKSEAQMRAIRGGEIAMIFQEPMTALNPLHTIGAQIGEVLGAARRRPRRGGAGAGDRRCSSGRHSRADAPRRRLPAPALGRPAAAGDDRHGARLPARACSSPTSRPRRSTSPSRRRSSLCSTSCRPSSGWRCSSSPTTSTSSAASPSRRRHGARQAGRVRAHRRRLRRAAASLHAGAAGEPAGAGGRARRRRCAGARRGERGAGGASTLPVAGSATTAFDAVRRASLRLRRGETLGIVGESGSGKTILGLALARAAAGSRGRRGSPVDGVRLDDAAPATLRALRRRIPGRLPGSVRLAQPTHDDRARSSARPGLHRPELGRAAAAR